MSDVGASKEKYRAFNYDPSKNTPVISKAIDLGGKVRSLRDFEFDSDNSSEITNDITDAMADITDIGINGYALIEDPLGWLISTGLGFLVDVIKPLNDALGYVTGNPERMEADIDSLGEVAAGLNDLARDVRESSEQHLSGWQGEAAEAAKQKLDDYAIAVEATAVKVQMFAACLSLIKTLMEAARALVLSIISMFVEWLVITWIAAQAAAPVTAGASEGAAAAATEVEAEVATSRAVEAVNRVMKVLEKFGKIGQNSQITKFR